ncbi:MAG: ATPase [Syntrophobacterales bacterium]|nr:ATPase [Syntrophobacterales bacterium]
MNLAQRLLQAKILTPEQLGLALARQKRQRGFLAKHLLELNLVTPEELKSLLPPFPPEPQSFRELGVPEPLLAALFLKHAYHREVITSREMAEALKIPEPLVEQLIEYLKGQKYLDVKPRDLIRPEVTHLAVELRYVLSESGRRKAEAELEHNSYVGPAPVPLEDYWDWVEYQTIQQVTVDEPRLREVLADYVLTDDFIHKLGPAVSSGRSLFLYGPTGSGKTVLAKAVGDAFDDPVFVPYALYVYGQIIRIFDEVNHHPVPPAHDVRRQDRRWVLCRRPLVIAGGEMTEDSLELRFNPVLRYYEAPHQLRANNGVFLIDDFGRQKISPRHLLNRWMYPLETRQDFLTLNTGQQFAVPFDQLVIFATNLDPQGLADPAFLRRIRHKIYVGHVEEEQYLEIFRRVCAQQNLAFNLEAVRQMMRTVYASRPMNACHPRDLVDNLLDRARFLKITPELTPEQLEEACRSYFVSGTGIIDYDALGAEPRPLP